MVKQNAKRSFINFTNFCVENIPSNLTYLHNIQPGVDLGFFLGGDAPLRNDTTEVFCRIPVILESQMSSQGGAWTSCTLPLDLPLILLQYGRNASKWRGCFFVTVCSHLK